MDLTTRFGTITLSRTIEVFAPIFVLAHNWNLDDKHEKVLAGKKQYIRDILLEEVRSKRLKGKIVSNLAYDAEDEPVGYELDFTATSFDIKEATQFLFGVLRKTGSPILRQMVQGGELRGLAVPEEVVAGKDDIDANICIAVEAMPLPILKKKVKELTNEKVKWDRSIEIAAKIGLLFYEKQLAKPASEKSFVAEYEKEFQELPKLPNTAVSKIYKALPVEYRNLGGSPQQEIVAIDPIIKAAVLAGAQSGGRNSMNVKSLRKSLSVEKYEIPDESILEKIIASVMTLEIEED